MTHDTPEMERAREIIYAFLVAMTLRKHGIPNDPGPLLEHDYSDVDIHEGDLHRLTGWGSPERSS